MFFFGSFFFLIFFFNNCWRGRRNKRTFLWFFLCGNPVKQFKKLSDASECFKWKCPKLFFLNWKKFEFFKIEDILKAAIQDAGLEFFNDADNCSMPSSNSSDYSNSSNVNMNATLLDDDFNLTDLDFSILDHSEESPPPPPPQPSISSTSPACQAGYSDPFLNSQFERPKTHEQIVPANTDLLSLINYRATSLSNKLNNQASFFAIQYKFESQLSNWCLFFRIVQPSHWKI